MAKQDDVIDTPQKLAQRQAKERSDLHQKHQQEYSNLKESGDPDLKLNTPDDSDVKLNTPAEYKANKLNNSKVE